MLNRQDSQDEAGAREAAVQRGLGTRGLGAQGLTGVRYQFGQRQQQLSNDFLNGWSGLLDQGRKSLTDKNNLIWQIERDAANEAAAQQQFQQPAPDGSSTASPHPGGNDVSTAPVVYPPAKSLAQAIIGNQQIISPGSSPAPIRPAPAPSWGLPAPKPKPPVAKVGNIGRMSTA